LLQNIIDDTDALITEFIEKCPLRPGSTFLIGCSTSEIQGKDLGSASNAEAAEAVFETLRRKLNPMGVNLAVQCCEHLNRCVVLERAVAERLNLPEVNVIPQPTAGGAFATHAYRSFDDPAVVESVKADYGLDIGLVMIGMHLKEVVVPVRLAQRKIGEATVVCARTRPKFVGGSRAVYDALKL
jgi:uncharacterized protein (TIGR01440 family)